MVVRTLQSVSPNDRNTYIAYCKECVKILTIATVHIGLGSVCTNLCKKHSEELVKELRYANANT